MLRNWSRSDAGGRGVVSSLLLLPNVVQFHCIEVEGAAETDHPRRQLLARPALQWLRRQRELSDGSGSSFSGG